MSTVSQLKKENFKLRVAIYDLLLKEQEEAEESQVYIPEGFFEGVLMPDKETYIPEEFFEGVIPAPDKETHIPEDFFDEVTPEPEEQDEHEEQNEAADRERRSVYARGRGGAGQRRDYPGQRFPYPLAKDMLFHESRAVLTRLGETLLRSRSTKLIGSMDTAPLNVGLGAFLHSQRIEPEKVLAIAREFDEYGAFYE